MAARRPEKTASAQALEDGPNAPHGDWSERASYQVNDPARYTRFVTIMKRALLLAALALIAAVIAYSLQPREQNHVAMTFERVGSVANDLAMIKPRLSGTDSSGNPFVVTADRAVQDGPDAHRARLVNVQADVTLDNNTWLSASARSGLLDADKKALELSGAISVYSDNGYELHTERAHIDLEKGAMHGDTTVTGHGPGGSLRADRFTVNRDTQQVRLLGHVKMEFYTHGAKAK